jgi:hypothetical protein
MLSSKEAQRTVALPLDLCMPLHLGPGHEAATKISGVNLTAIQVSNDYLILNNLAWK